ncbi:FluG domain-containing protein [Russula earlei]|uniref:FluG domain-containing protein n=1 Tax=Russula earlei TaxID=71964 RepID=A0ACC0UMB1_9AGAM|nr:FluG domain-containing protein [Russula earlei]
MFNIAYDRRIFSSERQHLYYAACYLVLAYTGCRPAEIVDGEKPKPLDGSWDKLSGSETVTLPLEASPDDEVPDAHSRRIAKLFEFETVSRGCPKVLCYEDIKLQVVRHPETGRDTLTMSITFTHHKGCDNRPKPYRSDGAFESPTQTGVDAVFAASISGPVSYLPLRWKEEWLKRPVFRRCDGDLNSPLSYRTLHDYVGRQTLDMGYEMPIKPKDWRMNVGNEANRLAADTVRDQITRHNNHSNVFQDAYLTAHVMSDVQNAVLGEPHQTAVLNM